MMKRSFLTICTLVLGFLSNFNASSATESPLARGKKQLPLVFIDISASVNTWQLQYVEKVVKGAAPYVQKAGAMPYVFWSGELSEVQLWDGKVKNYPKLDSSGSTRMAPTIKAARMNYQLCAGTVIMVDSDPIDDELEYKAELRRVLRLDIAVYVLVVGNMRGEKISQYARSVETEWIKKHRSFASDPAYRVDSIREVRLAEAFDWVRENSTSCGS